MDSELNFCQTSCLQFLFSGSIIYVLEKKFRKVIMSSNNVLQYRRIHLTVLFLFLFIHVQCKIYDIKFSDCKGKFSLFGGLNHISDSF